MFSFSSLGSELLSRLINWTELSRFKSLLISSIAWHSCLYSALACSIQFCISPCVNKLHCNISLSACPLSLRDVLLLFIVGLELPLLLLFMFLNCLELMSDFRYFIFKLSLMISCKCAFGFLRRLSSRMASLSRHSTLCFSKLAVHESMALLMSTITFNTLMPCM